MDSNLLEDDLKENECFLSSKPIVRNAESNVSPMKIYPVIKLNENYHTPLRNKEILKLSTPVTPFSRTPTHNPMVTTPNGSKITHPFLLHTIQNMGNYMMSDSPFIVKEKSMKDSSVLSPDIIGTLFPEDIDTESDVQYLFEAAIYKQYDKLLKKKSDQFFKNENIYPSPEVHDSGLGVSIEDSNISMSSVNSPMSLLSHHTPPSKYKWNSKEYRKEAPASPTMEFSYEFNSYVEDNSNEEEYSMNFGSTRNHFESTQIYEDGECLAANLSMRNHSIIRPSNFDDDELMMSFVDDTSGSFSDMRTSPNSKLNFSSFDDLGISPIKIKPKSMDADEAYLFQE